MVLGYGDDDCGILPEKERQLAGKLHIEHFFGAICNFC